MSAAQLVAVIVVGRIADSTAAALATLTDDADESVVWRSVVSNAVAPISMQLECNAEGL